MKSGGERVFSQMAMRIDSGSCGIAEIRIEKINDDGENHPSTTFQNEEFTLDVNSSFVFQYIDLKEIYEFKFGGK